MKMELGKSKDEVQRMITIPPMLPKVLKSYAKAAIKTQPYDLLSWSASYFKALSEGKNPPAKAHIEYPSGFRTKGGLTEGFLKLIIEQFSNDSEINKDVLKSTWIGISLEENEMKQILCTAGLYNMEKFQLNKYIAVAAGLLTKSLKETMILLCRLLTKEPEGGSAAISVDLFIDLYVFLASINASKTIKYIDGKPEATSAKSHELTENDDRFQDNDTNNNGKNNGRPVTLRVFSEEGERLDKNGVVPSPVPSKDGVGGSKISVKEMESVIQQIQKTQEEKVKSMEETLQSLENIVEDNKIINKNIDLLRKDSDISKTFIENEMKSERASIKSKSDSTDSKVDPNAKGVINPVIKGIFDNVAEKIGVINTWQQEVFEKQSEMIIVPAIPGIGGIVEDEIVEIFLKYVKECGLEQNNMFMPRDMRFSICPRLEKLI